MGASLRGAHPLTLGWRAAQMDGAALAGLTLQKLADDCTLTVAADPDEFADVLARRGLVRAAPRLPSGG